MLFNDEEMDMIAASIKERFPERGHINNPMEKDRLPSDEETLEPVTGHNINTIPGLPGDICHRVLVVSCMGKARLLGERLREMVYHAGIFCAGQNHKVLLVTSCWDDKVYQPHRRAIEELKRRHHLRIYKMQLESGRFVESEL